MPGDQPALIAFLHDEPGADAVVEALAATAAISVVNWAEMLSKVAADAYGDRQDSGAPQENEEATPRSDMRVYTGRMKIVKVRRVGNSNVVSIPREFEANGYTPGSSVLVEELPDGELRIMPTEKLREHIGRVGRRIVSEHPEALRILAEHDPDE